MVQRRSVLVFLLGLAATAYAKATIIFGGKPFTREITPPPTPVDPSAPWTFFNADEAATIEAIVDRLIPADELSMGGKEAGCAVFLDRQLAGDYGKSVVQYLSGPAAKGTPQQGPQFTNTIAQRYRINLAALENYCRGQYAGKGFSALDADAQDKLLGDLEAGHVTLKDVDGISFFNQLLQNTREGYFADPIYGGNKDMVDWKLVGFPGARYDYRDYIGRRGEDLKLIPVSLIDRVGT